jgi:hypothetical protein
VRTVEQIVRDVIDNTTVDHLVTQTMADRLVAELVAALEPEVCVESYGPDGPKAVGRSVFMHRNNLEYPELISTAVQMIVQQIKTDHPEVVVDGYEVMVMTYPHRKDQW